MAVKTKTQLKTDFSDNMVATGAKFTDLIDSLKAVQAAVSDPSASGTSVTFIATISQNENGEISATKKTVNFNGYQTTAAMQNYQQLDVQQVGSVTAAAGGRQTINHNMKHYPTVRLMDSTGVEVKVTEYTVKHADNMSLDIILGGSLTGDYRYILD